MNDLKSDIIDIDPFVEGIDDLVKSLDEPARAYAQGSEGVHQELVRDLVSDAVEIALEGRTVEVHKEEEHSIAIQMQRADAFAAEVARKVKEHGVVDVSASEISILVSEMVLFEMSNQTIALQNAAE
jgi:hypothetical protein